MAGVNPARAGMILVLGQPLVGRDGKPRASGDDPARDLITNPDST